VACGAFNGEFTAIWVAALVFCPKSWAENQKLNEELFYSG